jgi:hypothetical protein
VNPDKLTLVVAEMSPARQFMASPLEMALLHFTWVYRVPVAVAPVNTSGFGDLRCRFHPKWGKASFRGEDHAGITVIMNPSNLAKHSNILTLLSAWLRRDIE